MDHLDIDDLLEDADSGSDNDDFKTTGHEKLVERVKALYGSREVRQRTEPSTKISEFEFSRNGGLTAYDMLKDLNNTEESRKKRNKVLKLKKKAAALPIPLPKVSRERLHRAIAYAKTSNEIKKWDPIVEHHENADQIYFPLNDEKIRVETGAEFTKKFEPSTNLEKEVEALLSSSKHRLDSDAALSKFEAEQLNALTKEEAVARLSELRKLRSLMHGEALRNRRVRKIKSRKFHRMQRKDKMKQAIRDFEQLKITNPQKALEKLEELEQIRREERVSLRHKTKNRWAIQVAKKGKFDKEAQETLRERIELGRELETKVKMQQDEPDDDDDDDDGDDGEDGDYDDGNLKDKVKATGAKYGSSEEERDELEKSLQMEEENDHQENPWLRRTFFEEVKLQTPEANTSIAQSTPVTMKAEKSTGQILVVPEHMRNNKPRKELLQSKKKTLSKKQICDMKTEHGEENAEESSSDEDEEEDTVRETTEILDPYGNVDIDVLESRISEGRATKKALKRKLDTETPKSAIYINPENVLTVGKVQKLKSHLKLNAYSNDDDDDDKDDDDATAEIDIDKQRKLIQEAFAGDDVVQDFIKEQKEKNAEERKAEREAALQKKGLDGDWVTPNNINRLDDRKAKFLQRRKPFKPQAAVVHDDANLKGIRKLKVVDVPRGFTSVSQFETVLKQPVGNMFNTPRAFQELTKRRIVTKMGKLIKPIDESSLVKTIKSDLKCSKRKDKKK